MGQTGGLERQQSRAGTGHRERGSNGKGMALSPATSSWEGQSHGLGSWRSKGLT